MKELHILIIEDDEDLAKSLELFLGEIAQTTVSYDGFEGQMLGQEGIYDLAGFDAATGERLRCFEALADRGSFEYAGVNFNG